MSNTLLKIALVATGLLVAQQVQAAGFSAAFGPLRTLAATTTGAVSATSSAENFCIALSGSDLARADLAAFGADATQSWDI